MSEEKEKKWIFIRNGEVKNVFANRKEAIKYCCYFVRILTRLNTTMLNYGLTLTVIKAFHNFFLIF